MIYIRSVQDLLTKVLDPLICTEYIRMYVHRKKAFANLAEIIEG